MSFVSDLPHTTLVFKTTQEGLAIQVDLWAPRSALRDDYHSDHRYPALLYFHGGGFAVGARDVWIPPWLFMYHDDESDGAYWYQDRVTDRGYIFISADYRLIPSCTAYDIIEDVQDLWTFLTNPGLRVSFNGGTPSTAYRDLGLRIDASRIPVAGSSAGGLITYLAAMHCRNPSPQSILSIYGVGGQIFSSYYLSPKSSAFTVHSFQMLRKEDYQDFVYPFPNGIPPPVVANSYPEYAFDHPLGPSYPANPRMQLIWLYLQHGEALDYLTGQHQPSLSASLRVTLGLEQNAGTQCDEVVVVSDKETLERAANSIDARHKSNIFPQFNVTGDWPATAFIHGTGDTGVPVEESRHMYRLLQAAGVASILLDIEGEEHAFDYAEDAEGRWGEAFDAIVEFVCEDRRNRDPQ